MAAALRVIFVCLFVCLLLLRGMLFVALFDVTEAAPVTGNPEPCLVFISRLQRDYNGSLGGPVNLKQGGEGARYSPLHILQ